jgi:hypothetical protein
MDRRKRQGHPARLDRKQRRALAQERYLQPDATERVVQDLNHRLREELRERPPEDGVVSGPLAVAAHYAVPTLLADFDLDQSHTGTFGEWLTVKFGDVLRDPDIDGYLTWREDCRERAAATK